MCKGKQLIKNINFTSCLCTRSETKKLEDLQFLKFIDNYDISILTETWNAGNTTTNVNIKTDYFGNLEKSILIYKGKRDTFITGDLNAFKRVMKPLTLQRDVPTTLKQTQPAMP